VLTFVRHSVPVLWQRLTEADRRRFVRHVRCYWDVHRHRLPAPMAQRLEALRATGKLEINAGRIVAIDALGARVHVTWQCRGSEQLRSVTADALINATGARHSVARTPDPLLRCLHDAGLVCEDRLGLGLRTTGEGACVGGDGRASEALFYLGPMLRAGHWEATAATELRDHAERLARHVSQRALSMPIAEAV
jgi:uncharacterized NAD(P)/FAD-binding protein YdhS